MEGKGGPAIEGSSSSMAVIMEEAEVADEEEGEGGAAGEFVSADPVIFL